MAAVQTKVSLTRQVKGVLPDAQVGIREIEQEITDAIGLDLGTPTPATGFSLVRVGTTTTDEDATPYSRLYFWGDGVWWPADRDILLGEWELGGGLLNDDLDGE